MRAPPVPAPTVPFRLMLPSGSRDASTYCYVLETRESFRPTVVVKRDAAPDPAELLPYVRQQCERLGAQLEAFELLEAREAGQGGVQILFEWGSGRRRFRQLQRYLPVDGAVFSMTGTQRVLGLDHGLIDHRATFESIFDSFAPTPREGEPDEHQRSQT